MNISLIPLILAAIVLLYVGLKAAFRPVPVARGATRMAVMKGSIARSEWTASQLGLGLPATIDYSEYDSPAYLREKPKTGVLVTPIPKLSAPAGKAAAYVSPRKVMFDGAEFLLNAGENPQAVLGALEQSGATVTRR